MFGQEHMLADEFKKETKNKGVIFHKGRKAIYKPSHPKAWGSGYVYEHKLIMEVVLGRYLNDDEIVHHIDGNKLNNDVLNLQIVSASKHRAIHNVLDKKNKLHYDIQKVEELYLKGYSCRKIAQILNIGKSTVSRYVKELGISRPNMSNRDENGKFTERGLN